MSPQTGATGLVPPPSPAAPTNHLRDAITAHLDDWADEFDSAAAEQQIEGYRAAVDNATTDTALRRIANELGVHP